MNSVLQQLFMIKAIRSYILSVDLSVLNGSSSSNQQNIGNNSGSALMRDSSAAPANDSSAALFDDLDETDGAPTTAFKKASSISGGGDLNSGEMQHQQHQQLTRAQTEDEQRKEYHLTIFKHLQMIFGHLAESKMQYYVPKGFWRQFRFGGGEKVGSSFLI